MASLKEVKTKIVGVKKTAQITKAMNMVASAKLRGAQDKMEAFRPYTAKFNEAMSNLSAGVSTGGSYPLMEKRDVKSVELIVITSDRGLCGSFNSNIIKLAEQKMRDYEAEGKTVSFLCVGKKGFQILKKTGKVRKTYGDIMGTFQMFNAREIATEKPGVSVVTSRLVNGAQPGGILLLHDIHSSSIDATPATVDQLKRRGFRFLTISQLISLEGR